MSPRELGFWRGGIPVRHHSNVAPLPPLRLRPPPRPDRPSLHLLRPRPRIPLPPRMARPTRVLLAVLFHHHRRRLRLPYARAPRKITRLCPSRSNPSLAVEN